MTAATSQSDGEQVSLMTAAEQKHDRADRLVDGHPVQIRTPKTGTDQAVCLACGRWAASTVAPDGTVSITRRPFIEADCTPPESEADIHFSVRSLRAT